MAISIDWPAKVIFVPQADLTLVSGSNYTLDLNVFRLALKDLEDGVDGITWPQTHNHNAPVDVGGVTLARVVELVNEYTVTFEDGQYAVTLVGANSNVGANTNINQVSVRTVNSAGLIQTQVEEIQFASFQNGVTYDATNGKAGTLYPIGTPGTPSNNIEDTLLIAAARGLTTVYVRGALTTNSSHVISSFRFVGRNAWRDHLHTFVGGTLTDCVVSNLHISGPLYGTSVIQEARCGSISSFAGEMVDCVLESGTTTVIAGGVALFVRCRTGSSATSPSINHGGTGEVHVRDFHGSLTFTNKTGGNASTADFSSGFANIDATCTGGELKIRGVAGVSNLAAGMKLTTNALLSAGVESLKHTVESNRDTHQAFGERFYVDATNGRDTNAGDSVSSALQTVAAALAAAVSGRGDVIYLLAPGTGAATFTERLDITKEDIHIRGPGRGVQFQPSTANAGDVITVSADNCSFSGFVVRAPAGSTTDNCITVNGKFAHFSKLYLVGTLAGTGHGFLFRGGDYHELHNCESEKMGGSGLKTEDAGLSSGSPREISIIGGNYYLNNRDGIELTGNPATPTNSTRIIRLLSPNIHNNLRYGLSVDANTTKVDIHAETSLHGNPTDIFTLNPAETHRDSEWDDTNSLESGMTLREAMRVVTAALAGKLSGAPAGPVVIRNIGDTKNRITATVDSNGNRTAVTTDGS